MGEVDEGAALVSRAINLDPNMAAARRWGGGWIHLYLGEIDTAIKQFEFALRLSPLNLRNFVVQTGLAYANFFVGRDDEASTLAATAIGQQPNYFSAQLIMMEISRIRARTPFAGRKISEDWRRLTGSRGCRNDCYSALS
ncbi:tetratricopeptide repeat protein [Bradyrhizobium sp. CB3481]|uniref:tetratricopeptide repeat protein n=1 Tax=Bradyrhizobium sp. CB3481 TaxID=3039158 RepID=UPI0024B16624|nr:tetratricopeptide repeat protein [Bradyrhizobium sp. CB3481]WFU20794.1 tetratricopeptide repeat protein [Bradyrhizobium sp. CB3481]